MKVSIQVETISALNEALKSNLDKVRFGAEFCEWKIPSLEILKKAYALVLDQKKEFIYVTPRVANVGLEVIREQLIFLDSVGAGTIVVNDLGVLDLVTRYQTLEPCLGRQLVYMPARSPWKQITRVASDTKTRKQVEQVFYQTALNYSLTSRFFQQIGVHSIDVDWIPQCYPYFSPLIQQGFSISIHLFLIPITVTRKCHTARLLGEETPETCSKRCFSGAFVLKQKDLGMEYYLSGNVVYRVEKPTGREFNRLRKMTDVDLVIAMTPIQQLNKGEQINEIIGQLQPKRFGFLSRI